MMKLLAVIALVVILSGCGGQKDKGTTQVFTNPTAQNPSTDFQRATSTIHQDNTALQTTTGNINKQVETGKQIQPADAKPLLEPVWTGIQIETGKQQMIEADLAQLEIDLNKSQDNAKLWEDKYRKDMVLMTDKYQKSQADNVKLKASATTALNAKLVWLSLAGVGGLILAGVLFFLGISSKVDITVAAASAIALGVSVTLLTTLWIIPWIVGGIMLLLTGFIIFEIAVKHKTIKDLVGAVRATKIT